MGFWDGLGSSVIGGLFSLGGSMMGGASSAQGIEQMNAANMQIAKDNRDFQERMSNTAHTREVTDLRNAGLNPILSATGGSGASSPGGSVIPMQNAKEQSSLMMAQAGNLAANTAKTIAETNTEKTKQVLNDSTSARVSGGTFPGTDIPNATIAKYLSSAKSAYENINKFTKRTADIAISGPLGAFSKKG
ncbi:MAG: DNA pilot protein [Microvirus sp.]|nr:MAG: DNA pilot protein [Microvirus sp.]